MALRESSGCGVTENPSDYRLTRPRYRHLASGSVAPNRISKFDLVGSRTNPESVMSPSVFVYSPSAASSSHSSDVPSP